MKRKQIDAETTSASAEDDLCRALLAMRGLVEMRSFLRDLCTPAELEALIDRWRVVPYLLEGMAYRDIHDRTGVSVTTIGRVARFLAAGNGGYLAAVEHRAVPSLRKRGRSAGTLVSKRSQSKSANRKPAF